MCGELFDFFFAGGGQQIVAEVRAFKNRARSAVGDAARQGQAVAEGCGNPVPV